MSTSRVRTSTMTWDDASTIDFFCITASLFSPDFCFGASVLLASYDEDVREENLAPATCALRWDELDRAAVRGVG